MTDEAKRIIRDMGRRGWSVAAYFASPIRVVACRFLSIGWDTTDWQRHEATGRTLGAALLRLDAATRSKP